jgi:hypothetical protein
MKLPVSVLALFAFLLLGSTAFAGLITIDFEGLANMPHHIVQPVPISAQLSDQFLSSYGVRFSSGSPFVSVLYLGPNHATSGSNGIGGSTPDGKLIYHDGYPIVISFFDVDNPAVKATTDFVSVRGDLAGSNLFSVTLNAFDANGNLIGSDSKMDVGGETLTISVPGIHYVQFKGTPFTMFPDQAGVALDDLSFNTPTPVPEPSLPILLGIGSVYVLGCYMQRGKPPTGDSQISLNPPPQPTSQQPLSSPVIVEGPMAASRPTRSPSRSARVRHHSPRKRTRL